MAEFETEGKPNLTPILDMVFQLITFFMLVINFKAAEIDLTLKLPVVGSAKPVANHGKKILVLNVKSDNGKPLLSVYGHMYPEDQIKTYLNREAHASMMAEKLTLDDLHEGGKELPDIVVIRADESCPFANVNYVITTCQEEGYRSFALKALVKGGK
jgi:biopolymer transport protein ExbD